MRDRETIDSELRRIASMRRSIRERGARPSTREIDALLDERLGHQRRQPKPRSFKPVRPLSPTPGATSTKPATPPLAEIGVRCAASGPRGVAAISGSRRHGICVVVMFAVHHPHPAAEATDESRRRVPDPNRTAPARPKPPSAARHRRQGVHRRIETEGVPVPSHEYVMSHGHAVCDFLTQQPNFTEAVGLRAAIDDMGRESKRRIRRWCHRLVLPSIRTSKSGADAAAVSECSLRFASHPGSSPGHRG